MDHRDETFSPETVDEQIEQFLRTSQPSEQMDTSPAQMVQMLQGMYEENPRLSKVWKRLAEHSPAEQTSEELEEKQTLGSTIVSFPQERINFMPTQTRLPESPSPRKRGSFQRLLGLLVAVIVTIVLIGSLALVLSTRHQSTTTGSGIQSTATDSSRPKATPTPGCSTQNDPPVATATAGVAKQEHPIPTPAPCGTPPENGKPSGVVPPTPAQTPVVTPTPAPTSIGTPTPAQTPVVTPTPAPTPLGTPTPAPKH